jgi:hypothetical protein
MLLFAAGFWPCRWPPPFGGGRVQQHAIKQQRHAAGQPLTAWRRVVQCRDVSSAGCHDRDGSHVPGTVLTDGKGITVYLFEADTTTKPTCYGPCAAAWPPVLTAGAPVAGSGARASPAATAADGPACGARCQPAEPAPTGRQHASSTGERRRLRDIARSAIA